MKSRSKRSLILILSLLLVLTVLPMSALSADNEMVIMQATFGGKTVSVNGNTISLTVPYDYPGSTVDLSSDFTVHYDISIYASADPSFADPNVYIPGSTTLTLTYTRQDDTTDPKESFTTDYTVNVSKAAYVAPTFNGNISKEVSAPGTLILSLSDFTGLYTKNNGGSLKAVSFTGSQPGFGYLAVNGNPYDFGSNPQVPVSDITSDKLTFVATSVSATPVSFSVTAYYDDPALGSEASVSTQVTLTIQTRAPVAGDITHSHNSVNFGTGGTSSVVSKLQEECNRLVSMSLLSVTFTLPASSRGTLYYKFGETGQRAVGTSEALSLSADPRLADVTFVPSDAFTGTATIKYTAKCGDVGNPTTYTGNLLITVPTNLIAYKTVTNSFVTLNASDFSTVYNNRTGKILSYIKFTSLPSVGTLYHKYAPPSSTGTAVKTTENYYTSTNETRSIGYVVYVPASNTTGFCSFSFTGYDASNGNAFSGTVTVTVETAPVPPVPDDGGADSPVHSATLTITDENGKPLANTNFTLIRPNGTTARTKTNWQGQATFSNVPDGEYVISGGGYAGTVTLTNGSTTGPFALKADETPAQPPVGLPFNDMAGSYQKTLMRAYELSILTGYPDKTIRPGNPVTRAEFITMLMRAFSDTVLPEGAAPKVFDDASAIPAWAMDQVNMASAIGLILGDDNGSFNSNSNITRQEMFTVLHRLLAYSGIIPEELGEPKSFTDDESIAPYAQEAIDTLSAMGIVNGSGGEVWPLKSATRAEAAQSILNILDFLRSKGHFIIPCSVYSKAHIKYIMRSKKYIMRSKKHCPLFRQVQYLKTNEYGSTGAG